MELTNRNKHFSVSEVAAMLGISRIAVFKKIQKKQIPAEKVGRNYIIHANNIGEILGQKLGIKKKVFYNKAVKKVVKDYHRTLVLLGGE